MRRVFLVFLLALLAFPVGAEPLSIRTRDGGLVEFSVEIAKTRPEQEKGLMHRETLAERHGMLFLWDKEKTAAMWMKNTLIPLDMLFIDRQGKVVYIVRDVEPGSTRPIGAGQKVRAVLELPGGTAEKERIRVGDRVLHSAFTP